MTKFQDGPAHGKTLMLRRAPFFLRVVVGKEVDALDQPSDAPTPDEKLFAYQLVGKPGGMHLNTGRKPGGGFYPVATYKLVSEQPTDEQMRTLNNWRAWTEAHKHLAAGILP